jgi:hypothetical protein
MGFRFQRSVRILPFLRLHFSRDGVSASIGWQGAAVRIGRRSRPPRRSRAAGYFLAVLVLAFLVGISIALAWP